MKYVLLNPEETIDTPNFKVITAFLKSTGRTQIGWHYYIDLAWIYSQAKNWPTNFQILDVGGGCGPTQFLLTELGFNVTNIDLSLDYSTRRFQKRYEMAFKLAESYQKTDYVDHLSRKSSRKGILRKIKDTISSTKLLQYLSAKKYRHIHERWRKSSQIQKDVGRLNWIQANICNAPEIATDSFDAVVSLSALEHIPIELLPQAWTEITRICKPNAQIAITTSATEQKDTWFHNPSKGYCFSEQDIKTIFNAIPEKTNLPANEILEKYRSCTFLKNNLASFYYTSVNNGMPWGKWNPSYIPVGLFQ